MPLNVSGGRGPEGLEELIFSKYGHFHWPFPSSPGRAEGTEPLMQVCQEALGSPVTWAASEGASVNELSSLEDMPASS